MFKFIDADRSGSITKKELKDFLKENQVGFQNHEMDQLVKEIDVNEDDDINIEEFKAALLKEKNKIIEKSAKEEENV